MPTATKYLGYELHNLGPATTAFKPAATCSTASPLHAIEIVQDGGNGAFDPVDCSDPTYEGCLPNGKEIDQLFIKLKATPHNGNVMYRSPGISCPYGWTTAATVVGGQGKATSASGVFAQMPTQEGDSSHQLPAALIEAFVKPLDPSETLVWCCPSSFTANADVLCMSTLGAASDFSISSVCGKPLPSDDIATVSVVDGSTLSQARPIITGTDTSYKTLTIAAPTGPDASLVSMTPVVALVHKQSDIESAGKGTANSNSEPSSTGDGDEDSDNQGRLLRPSLRMVICSAALAAWLVKLGA